MFENKPIDAWILGGYLGAGKTTALNALLATPFFAESDPALIINEFGTIGVDGALIERRDLSRFEINKGSLFCICTKTDFIKALTRISEGNHKAVLIEATGIAEPVDIESFLAECPSAKQFSASLSKNCYKKQENNLLLTTRSPSPSGRGLGVRVGEAIRLRGNICVVDAVNFTKVAAFLRPVTAQVRWADIVIINKCDMATRAELDVLHKVIADINHTAPVHETSFGRFNAEILDNIQHSARAEQLRPEAPANIFAASFTADKPVPAAEFQRILDRMGENILRLKGNIVFDEGPAYVEMVCGARTNKQANTVLAETAQTKTAFTVICWNMEKEMLRTAMSGCGCVSS